MREQKHGLNRRDFLKKGAQATSAAAVAVAGLSTNIAPGAVPKGRGIASTDALPTRRLGKTNVELPILGFGGAALPKAWGSPL